MKIAATVDLMAFIAAKLFDCPVVAQQMDYYCYYYYCSQ